MTTEPPDLSSETCARELGHNLHRARMAEQISQVLEVPLVELLPGVDPEVLPGPR